MKHSLSRALIVGAALALGLVPAFAQLSIGGYYRVGGRTNVATDGTIASKFDDRIRLNLSFAAPDDMFGFKARLQADASGTTSGIANLFLNGVSGTVDTTAAANAKAPVTAAVIPPAISYAMGYAKLLDGMIKVTGGLLSVADYQVVENTGNIYLGKVATDQLYVNKGYSFLNSKTGLLVQAWPVEGLSVAGVFVEDGTKPTLNHAGFDAYYLMPGFGKVIVNSQFGLYSSTEASASDDLAKSFVSAGFQYVGLKGLSATAAVRMYNANYGAVAIVEYGNGPFWADVSADLSFTANSGAKATTYVEGEVSYLVIPQIKLRAYGAFDDGAKNNVFSSYASGTTMLGADLVFPIGKGELMAGVNYSDKANLQFPVLVKANF